jgi:hypothetical protein
MITEMPEKDVDRKSFLGYRADSRRGKCLGKGKTVRIRRGPAAVSGDESHM